MPYIELEGEVRALGPGVLTVGSGPEAGWRIQGRGLEPVHLMLSLETGGRALLIRPSPSAAVAINGVEMAPPRTLLDFGDRIAAGTAELRYRRLGPGGYLRDVRRGRLYQLHERSTIGRDLASTVVVLEPDVSRLHVELIQRGEAFLLVPHGVSVTSVNGSRLIAPTVLQEGDEIGVGRTVLRFTTAAPSSAAVVPDAAPPRAVAHVARDSRAQTTFMGVIEAREQRSRVVRRRLTRAAAIALVTIALAAAIVSLYADARTASGDLAHPPAHIGRRQSRSAGGPLHRAS